MPEIFRRKLETLLLGRFSIPDSNALCLTILAPALLLCSWLSTVHVMPLLSWHSEVFAFLAVAMCACVAVFTPAIKGHRLKIGLPMSAMPFIALALLAVVQAATGLMIFAGDALVFCLYCALCVAALTLGFASDAQSAGKSSRYQARGILEIVAITLLAGAFASSIVAYAQVLELWEQPSWINPMPYLRRPGGNIGQPNQLATLLLMGIASLLFLYESGKLKTASSSLIFVVLGTALAVTESRTGVLSFVLLALWWAVRCRSAGFKMSAWAVAFGSLAFLGFFLAWPSIYAFITQSNASEATINTAPGYRLIVWPQLLEALWQRPWLGWGLNQVPRALNTVASEYLLSEPYSYSHNIVIDLALGVGLPLAALMLLITGAWLWRRIKFAKRLMPWYCVAVVLPVAVHSMLEFPFAYAYFLAPVMLVLGVLDGLVGAKPIMKISVRPAAVLLLLVSAVAVWSVVEYVEVEEDFQIVRFEALRIGETAPSYERPHIVLLTQFDAMLSGTRIVPRPGMSQAELALAEKVALRYAWTATQNRYAMSLALNGRPEEAMRQLRVIRAIHGEKHYVKLKARWIELAQEKYPQLRGLALP